VAVARASTAAAFAEWVAPHLPVMARVAARLAPDADRDDVVQDALARAWRERGAFDPGRGSPAAWLCAIVASQARRTSRTAWRRRSSPVSVVPERAAPSTDVDAALDVERALGRLPRRQREAVDLHYFAGLSVAETATVMGCSAGTVKSTLSDARAALRRHLGETP